MERPTVEFTLPFSKVRIVFNAYLTIAEERKIKRVTYSAMKMKMEIDPKKAEETGSSDVKVQDIDGSFMSDSQDMAFEFLVKEVYSADGNKVENPLPYLKELPSADANALFDQVDKLTSGSVLTEDAKKN